MNFNIILRFEGRRLGYATEEADGGICLHFDSDSDRMTFYGWVNTGGILATKVSEKILQLIRRGYAYCDIQEVFPPVPAQPKITRPPLGIFPRWRHEELRLKDLEDAITRYVRAAFPIDPEWITERNELIEKGVKIRD